MFTEKYNDYILYRIKNLLNESKTVYKADLHIHSQYSPDGHGSLFEIINRTKNYNFDIISITDHDTVKIYDDLQKVQCFDVLNKYPIIVPGVEFTSKCKNYEGLCHILKYFINLNSLEIRTIIKQNLHSFYERAFKQFERIDENDVLNYYKDIGCYFDYNEYIWYVESKCSHPDYINLMEYIFMKLKNKGVLIKDVYNKVFLMCQNDICKTRKIKWLASLNRYAGRKNFEDPMTLLGILAPLGLDDDDFKMYKPLGSLSVNEYNNVSIEQVSKLFGLTVWAHPIINSIEKIDKSLWRKINIDGLEKNLCNWRVDFYDLKQYADVQGLFYTIGSDSHSCNDKSYENLDYYNWDKKQLGKFYESAKLVRRNLL